MNATLPSLEFCEPAARACASEWAAHLKRRPEHAKPAFWAGGSAVRLLLLLLHNRSSFSHYSNFVDIGAAIYAPDDDSDVGSGSMAFYKLWSRPDHPVKVHAFEPTDTHLDGLLARTKGQIKLHKSLVSDRPGVVDFYGTRNVATANPRLLRHPRYAQAKVRKVAATTVDLLASQEGMERLDILKTDTEGTEWEVLLGAHRLISQQRVAVILIAYEHPWSEDTVIGVYPIPGRKPAPTVRQMQTPSLWSVTRHLRTYGYDSYLLGNSRASSGGLGALHILPLSGSCWDDIFEFGRDPAHYQLPFTWFDFVAVVSDSAENELLRSQANGAGCFPGSAHLDAAARLQAANDEAAARAAAARAARAASKAAKHGHHAHHDHHRSARRQAG